MILQILIDLMANKLQKLDKLLHNSLLKSTFFCVFVLFDVFMLVIQREYSRKLMVFYYIRKNFITAKSYIFANSQ